MPKMQERFGEKLPSLLAMWSL